MKKLLDSFLKKKKEDARMKFMSKGFHGDTYLLKLVDFIMAQNVVNFIETGTNVGSTLKYTADKFNKVNCYSCETDEIVYNKAISNLEGLNNIKLFNKDAIVFLNDLTHDFPKLSESKNLFWLDAHGYGFKWPLREEISYITENFINAYILIDDFKVPHLDAFGYDVYEEQECSFEYIKDYFSTTNYKLYYPDYTEKTSDYHPLRGWGLIILGDNLEAPDQRKFKVKAY
ncbi:hypothetical protein [Marivirga sp.]|uniref:hypothetical protein n=1 Tax=Marivirga sp. TaxID=2018662 RepID=UPI0025DA38A1|nr:hypothetical protein [Marivirga sp.]